MGGIEGDHALLDRGSDFGTVRVDDIQTPMKLAGAKVVVVGMARSGVAAVELLREKGAVVRAVDQKTVAIEGIVVEAQSEAVFASADLILLSPGVPADLRELQAARERGVKIIGDLELASW